MASIEEQIKRLREMRNILDVFQMRLTNRMNNVENMLDDLVRMSFPIEIADKYRYRYLYDDKAIIEELAKSIQDEQFDYIDKKIKKLIETSEIN